MDRKITTTSEKTRSFVLLWAKAFAITLATCLGISGFLYVTHLAAIALGPWLYFPIFAFVMSFYFAIIVYDSRAWANG